MSQDFKLRKKRKKGKPGRHRKQEIGRHENRPRLPDSWKRERDCKLKKRPKRRS